MFGFREIFNRKPRQFDYRPRYYDLETERREQRKKELLGVDYREKHMTPEERAKNYVPGKYLRNNIKMRRGIGNSRRNSSSTVIRLVLVLFFCGLLIWWVLTSDFFNNLFEKWLVK